MAPAATIQVKDSTVCTHPPYHPSPSTYLCSTSHLCPSTPHHPCFVLTCSPCSSRPIFIVRSQFVSFPSIIEEWVKINNSQPIKGEFTYIPPGSVSQYKRSFGGSNEIRSELVLWFPLKRKVNNSGDSFLLQIPPKLVKLFLLCRRNLYSEGNCFFSPHSVRFEKQIGIHWKQN